MDYIEVKNLKRSFKVNKNEDFHALKGISFAVKKGEIFGLLGPNGAGKTTTMKILSTMLAPTDGTAKVMGFDTFGQEDEVREHINFVFGGERSLYWRLSAYDNLAYFADLYKIPLSRQKEEIPRLLKLVGLEDTGNKLVEKFSKGMKQRLQTARALLNDPEIIFLDEPSIGLDPIGARELRELIRKLADNGTTIVLTTHYLAEAEELCDRIAIINKGEIVALDTVAGLQNLLSVERRQEIIRRKEIENGERKRQKLEVNLEDIYVELLGGD
ncbi:ABC transporter [Floricoccus tropicus]|uniref:ABC transporter n=1 Tax=Floricoccus tropicus TaxID=1859473 RepID=A0A1E8GR07_9LACT|nr:ABC transporter ATP-binding protein [Floricoccus tropicus]OFI49928.1 ABC transporter [Floricoccus tropicus]